MRGAAKRQLYAEGESTDSAVAHLEGWCSVRQQQVPTAAQSAAFVAALTRDLNGPQHVVK